MLHIAIACNLYGLVSRLLSGLLLHAIYPNTIPPFGLLLVLLLAIDAINTIDTICSVRLPLLFPISTVLQVIRKLLQCLRLGYPPTFEPFSQFGITLPNEASNLEAINMDLESPILIYTRHGKTLPESWSFHESSRSLHKLWCSHKSL